MKIAELLKDCVSTVKIQIHDIDASMEYLDLSVAEAIRLYGERKVGFYAPTSFYIFRIFI